MRAENNPLDLNNLPEDFSRDGNKPVFEAGSSSLVAGCNSRKKIKNSGEEVWEKVYQCRFCSLKFCKSQALGGHMNRHRQERETEAMNRARQMVFGADHNNIAVPHHGCQSLSGAYPPLHSIGNPFLAYQSVYPHARLYSGASSSVTATLQQPPHAPSQQPARRAYLYPSPSRLFSYPSQFHSPNTHHSANDYYVDHVLSSSTDGAYTYGSGGRRHSDYTRTGVPVQDPPLSTNPFQDRSF